MANRISQWGFWMRNIKTYMEIIWYLYLYSGLVHTVAHNLTFSQFNILIRRQSKVLIRIKFPLSWMTIWWCMMTLIWWQIIWRGLIWWRICYGGGRLMWLDWSVGTTRLMTQRSQMLHQLSFRIQHHVTFVASILSLNQFYFSLIKENTTVCIPLLEQFLVGYYQQIRVRSFYVLLSSDAALIELLSWHLVCNRSNISFRHLKGMTLSLLSIEIRSTCELFYTIRQWIW